MRLFQHIALLVVLAPLPAHAAFEQLGLKSGMTPEQVRTAAPAGYGLRLNGDFGFIEKGGDLYATVTFCRGRLISLSRTVDAQGEWFSLADKMIRQYGNPKVTAAANPWAEAQAPGANGLEMSWRAGQNKYALTAFPSQPAKPGAKPQPSASVSVTDFGPANACLPRPRPSAAHAVPAKVQVPRRPRGRTKLSKASLRRPYRSDGRAPVYPRVEASGGGQASLRYPPGTREAEMLREAPPAAPSRAHDPFHRFIRFMKTHFGGGWREEQVASEGGRS